jgi:cyclic dehypoxanthinyl futalosine synthase
MVVEKIQKAFQRIDFEEGLRLFKQAPLEELQQKALIVRHKYNDPLQVTFVLDSNPNYTNVCEADCSFCSFYRKKGHGQAYTKSVEEVLQSMELAHQAGLSTVLLQGGLHPDLPLSYYVDLVKEARHRYPHMNCHFFSAPEIYNISQVESLTYTQVLEALYQAGQRSFPGGGAEILSEKVRKRISPKKMAPGAWIEIHRAAHQVGMKSTATMMYGHVETAEDILLHLESLRTLQDETGGFTAFIPWSYKRGGNPLGRVVKDWAGDKAYYRLLAFSRLYLDNIPHIQASWFSEGREIGIQALHYGADDFGGLLFEEEVHRATEFINKTTGKEMVEMIHEAGFDAAERNTFYDILKKWPQGTVPQQMEIQEKKKEINRLEVLKQASQHVLERWSVLK